MTYDPRFNDGTGQLGQVEGKEQTLVAEHPGRWPVHEARCDAIMRGCDRIAILHVADTRDYILALEAERDEYKERAEKLFETYCQVIKMDTE